MPVKNEALLTEIRDTFTRYVEAWRDIRDEGRKDMDFVAADWAGEPRQPKAVEETFCVLELTGDAHVDLRQQHPEGSAAGFN